MYLSRLILNPRNRRVQSEVGDPYQMHRSIMRAFPDGAREMGERVLFRLDTDPRSGTLALLVQSHLEPDWSWLAEPEARGYLLPVPEPNPWVKRFELRLEPGQRLAFRLRANPTVKKKDEKQGPKRRGLAGEEAQAAWLARKGEQGGFRVVAARIARQGEINGWVESAAPRQRYRLQAVQFDGLLEVTDPERLHDCVADGIGSGKGFGFGLLSLARAQ